MCLPVIADRVQAPGGSQALSNLRGAPDAIFKVAKVNRSPWVGGHRWEREKFMTSSECRDTGGEKQNSSSGREGEEPKLGLPRSGVGPQGCGCMQPGGSTFCPLTGSKSLSYYKLTTCVREGNFNSTHSVQPREQAALSSLHSWSPKNDIYGQRTSRVDKECREDPGTGREKGGNCQPRSRP